MQTKLFFFDESETPALNSVGDKIFALTGIIVTPEKCQRIRSSMVKIMEPLSIKNGELISLEPAEIHGSDFLRAESDELKVQIFTKLSLLPSEYNCPIYRTGVCVKQKSKELLKEKSTFYTLCWQNMLMALQPEYQESYFIPIVDSMDKKEVALVSRPLKSMNHFAYLLSSIRIGLKNFENIIMEGLYADSKYSFPIQLTDIISYLRCINDQVIERYPSSSFKKKLWSLNKNLHDNIIYDQVEFIDEKIDNRLFYNDYRI